MVADVGTIDRMVGEDIAGFHSVIGTSFQIINIVIIGECMFLLVFFFGNEYLSKCVAIRLRSFCNWFGSKMVFVELRQV
jgi:hypothetical protein